ncbi:hypothetical protein SLE2022_401720 [Rubroshorea leprosula]
MLCLFVGMENSESIEELKETNSGTIAVGDNATKNMMDGSTNAKLDKADIDASATRAGPSLSVQRKPMKCRAWVWKFFDEFIDENGKTRARCHFCGYDLAAESRTNGTTPLKNHYNSCKLNLVNVKTQQTLLNFQKVLEVDDVDDRVSPFSPQNSYGNQTPIPPSFPTPNTHLDHSCLETEESSS